MQNDEYQIAFLTIHDMLRNRESFSFDEIQDRILEKGGVLYVAFGTTIGQYIIMLENNGAIAFNPITERYDVKLEIQRAQAI